MKYSIIIITLFSSLSAAQDCSISLEPCWNNLAHNNTDHKKFGGQWILIGTITFRKKSKEPIKLNKICLHWHGSAITQLAGSLYKKLSQNKFYPLQENHLCDSTWNTKQQRLILDFSKSKQTLGPLSTFYVVLTVPEALEPTLKKGHFSINKAELPSLLDTNQNNELILNLAHVTQPK